MTAEEKIAAARNHIVMANFYLHQGRIIEMMSSLSAAGSLFSESFSCPEACDQKEQNAE